MTILCEPDLMVFLETMIIFFISGFSEFIANSSDNFFVELFAIFNGLRIV